MKSFRYSPLWLPAVVAIAALASFGLWLSLGPGTPLAPRVPGTDHAPGSEAGAGGNPVLAGKVIRFDGQPAKLAGAWPQFRGTNFDAISREPTPLLRTWQASEPRELWGVDVGEGYAGAAVRDGRVYLMDYDREKKQDALRCFSLEDGREIWRYVYSVSIKRNHGMTRTVPVVTDQLVVAMGPKCHVVCVDSTSGELRWAIDLVREYGTTVPQWYAGQCPFVDGGSVILAPGGKTALLLAVEAETGKPLWRSPNPRGWKMTHASITRMEFGGERMYIYCADKGVVGVSAKDGRILWETMDWKISIATVPSPLILDDGRIFLTGGYNAGSLMLQLKQEGDRFLAETQFRVDSKIFGATQQSPIAYENHIYGVRPDGRFACLGQDGKTVWASDSTQQFGLGGYLLADGLIFALNDSGLLRLLQATPEKYTLLSQAQVLKGRESWGPPALAGGRLLVRDFTRLICLDVSRK